MTIHKAFAAPRQAGSSRRAMIVLHHLGIAEEFRIQNSEARRKQSGLKRET